ncbi:hypothetical protein ACTWPT_37390 [Nonomuraea sp. 3N208]|uniref:hypothetical protein n=1 Tax=Nonomuraea sp. 3N208 TaxID=3457421 RepID=UPI003FD00F86
MNKRHALAGLLLAGAMAAVAGAGTAEASAGSAHLAIEPTGTGNWFVSVTGNAPAAGQRRVCFNLYGDDTFDHHLYGGFGNACSDTNSAGHYSISVYLPSYTLNEDWGRDEVYAKATFAAPGSPTVKSNTVTGYF